MKEKSRAFKMEDSYKCSCGAELDAALAYDHDRRKPEESDVSFCEYCSRIHVYVKHEDSKNLTLKELTSKDLDEIKNTEEEFYNLLIKVKSEILLRIENRKK